MSFIEQLPTDDEKRILVRLINSIVVTDGCWIWQGFLNKTGYPLSFVYKDGKSKTTFAHRLSYKLFKGEIPEDLVLDHLCRTPACINPTHLEAVTVKENTNRGVGSWANRELKTHCKNGHEFTPLNTGRCRSKGNARLCRTCMREANRQLRLRRKLQYAG